MKEFLFIVMLSLLGNGCDADDSNPTEPANENSHPIVGAWALTSYEPGFSPTSFYEENEITWAFDDEGQILVNIEENTSVNNTMPLPSNGEYTYYISNDIIYIEGHGYELTLENELLSIFKFPNSDGKRLNFEKISNH